MTKSSLFFSPDAVPQLPRRAFLRYAGATTAGAALLLAGCKKDDPTPPTTTATPTGETVALGSGDVALLNLLQAGKQLVVDLLGRIVATATALNLSVAELALLTAIRDQQIIHRDALKAAANANRTAVNNPTLSLPDLPADFSSLTLNERTSVLTSALGLLNTLVAGAAGGLRYAGRSATMTLLGQVLSVDARHATTLARMLPGTALTDPLGAAPDARNRTLRPSELAAVLNPLITFGSRLVAGNMA